MSDLADICRRLLASLEQDEDNAVTGIFSSQTYELMDELNEALHPAKEVIPTAARL